MRLRTLVPEKRVTVRYHRRQNIEDQDFNIRPHLGGDVLDVTRGVDLDGGVVKADLTILDDTGRQIGQPSSFGVGSADSIRIESQLSMRGLNVIPTAVRASLVLIDRDGNRSPAAIVDFGRAEAGGPAVNSASFDGSRLTIRSGGGGAEDLEVEVNGHVVAPPRAIKVKGGGKLIVRGDASQLSLQQGANRIRVKNPRGWSNILILGT